MKESPVPDTKPDDGRRKSKTGIEMSPELRDVANRLMIRLDTDSIHEVVRRALYYYERALNRLNQNAPPPVKTKLHDFVVHLYEKEDGSYDIVGHRHCGNGGDALYGNKPNEEDARAEVKSRFPFEHEVVVHPLKPRA